MATTIGVFFKHDYISKGSTKKPSEPYTARAHSRYVQRQSATQHVYTHLMPEDYHERQRWFYDLENETRQKGRIIDKFTVAIPHDVSQEHAAQMLESYGKRIGQERCSFMFTLQGFDTNNHHSHFIFVDKDIETRRRVYGTTKLNSTQGLKAEWQTLANGMLQELGYDIRVRVRDEQQLVVENDNKRSLHPENDNQGEAVATAAEEIAGDEVSAEERVGRLAPGEEVQQELPLEPISTDTPIDEEPESAIPEESSTHEEQMAHGTLESALASFAETLAATRQAEADQQTVARAESESSTRIRRLYDSSVELGYLREQRAALGDANDRITYLMRQREKVSEDAQKHFEEIIVKQGKSYGAQAHLQKHQKANGNLKGLRIKLLGIDFATARRQRAEQAAKEERERTADADRAKRIQKDYENHIAELQEQLSEAMSLAEALRNSMLGPDEKDELLQEREGQLFADNAEAIEDSRELTASEVWASWKAGEITDEQVRVYCQATGNRVMLAELEYTIEGQDYSRGGQSL